MSFFGDSGSGGGSFPIKKYETTIIYTNGTTQVFSATPTINFTGTSTSPLGISLSNDNGVTWENATNETNHTFSTGGTALKLRVMAGTGWVIGSSTDPVTNQIIPGVRVDYFF